MTFNSHGPGWILLRAFLPRKDLGAGLPSQDKVLLAVSLSGEQVNIQPHPLNHSLSFPITRPSKWSAAGVKSSPGLPTRTPPVTPSPRGWGGRRLR